MDEKFDFSLTVDELHILIHESRALIQTYWDQIREEEAKIEEYKLLLSANDLPGSLRSLRSSTTERIRKVFRHKIMQDLMKDSSDSLSLDLLPRPHAALTEDMFQPPE